MDDILRACYLMAATRIDECETSKEAKKKRNKFERRSEPTKRRRRAKPNNTHKMAVKFRNKGRRNQKKKRNGQRKEGRLNNKTVKPLRPVRHLPIRQIFLLQKKEKKINNKNGRPKEKSSITIKIVDLSLPFLFVPYRFDYSTDIFKSNFSKKNEEDELKKKTGGLGGRFLRVATSVFHEILEDAFPTMTSDWPSVFFFVPSIFSGRTLSGICSLVETHTHTHTPPKKRTQNWVYFQYGIKPLKH